MMTPRDQGALGTQDFAHGRPGRSINCTRGYPWCNAHSKMQCSVLTEAAGADHTHQAMRWNGTIQLSASPAVSWLVGTVPACGHTPPCLPILP
jgi:hypothetical protein